MKYGEQFEKESVPQWRLYNIDYNSLKHHIKVHTTKDQATAIAIPGRPNTALTKFENDFYSELCRQHDRVDLFVSSKADEIARRLQHLSSQIHRLILRCATSGSEHMPLKRRQRFAKYEQILLQCGDDIKSLQRFVDAQVVAFRKILKKYRKWTGSSTLGVRFKESMLSHPKSFTKRDFSQLQSQYDDLFNTLYAALPAMPTGGMALPESERRHSRPTSAQLSPSETIVATEAQPAAGYWNEYDCGSEVGDLERNADTEYAIYIDSNHDVGFPGIKILGDFFAKPITKLTAWVSFHPDPRDSDTTSDDPEQNPLLGTHPHPDPGPYGSARSPAEHSYFSSSPGGTASTATAAGTDTDLEDDPSSARSASNRQSRRNSGSFSRGYTSSSDDHFPSGYSTHYAALPSIADQRIVRYRERVLRWATWGCFGVAFVLMGIAAVLIAAGRNRMRLEVDAGVTVGIMTSLGLACAGFCMMSSRRDKVGLVGRLAVILSVGVGFILCHPSFATHFLTTALPLLRQHRPRAVWLFAPRLEDVASGRVRDVVAALRGEGFVVLFQVGTVAAARQAVRDGADVLVVQGVDAGGHQFVGAAGVFVAAEEAWTPEFRKKLIIETTDGGPSTVKTPLLDDIQSTAIWPSVYDGRGLIGKSWLDHTAGMPMEENIRLFKEADKAGDTSRKINWVGTGVGLIRDVRPAGDIVREAREDAIKRIQRLQSAM
ncbi:hypothetical protein C8A00DRAFT_45959 [Chaetomidium leptoderma]|uniref:SPX domain-containing protein n=1 Tax=Chaetomidium leptoderma TaxID=669021 RepID=A0AAN6ZSX7_9PEZI|nr:hypothetical protein C8A00DRAFT_45959 [Chaetomidium leptoderma]